MAKTVDAEILSLVHQAKRAAYEAIGLDSEATNEHRKACQLVFDAAIAAYEARRYRDSLRPVTGKPPRCPIGDYEPLRPGNRPR